MRAPWWPGPIWEGSAVGEGKPLPAGQDGPKWAKTTLQALSGPPPGAEGRAELHEALLTWPKGRQGLLPCLSPSLGKTDNGL